MLHDQVKLLYGDFSSFDDFFQYMDHIDYAIFVIAAIIGSLVIFNLLVAIFTDTYDEIKEHEKAIELRMMNEVVSETEQYLKAASCHIKSTPMHICFVNYQRIQTGEWEGKVKVTTSIVDKGLIAMENRFNSKLEDLQKNQNMIMKMMKGINEKLNE
jgi:hypothetical protein